MNENEQMVFPMTVNIIIEVAGSEMSNEVIEFESLEQAKAAQWPVLLETYLNDSQANAERIAKGE